MACGLKKQNTNEGGVHLTERTCSPYNPIIKLIVDDCLGLPIYPVTSIDAVIDEDGNTLRKLLEDLLDQIHTGGSITELIEHILLIIEDLDETYVTKTELTQKLELLYKISSMNRTNVDGVLNYDTTETTKPYIVKIIEDILSDLAGIISGGDGITLLGLLEQITALNNLLIAVANYDTGSHTDDGLTHSLNNTIPQIEIIYRIQDLITRLGDVERAIGTGSSIDTRLEEIERALAGLLDGASTVLGITDALDGRVDTLETASATHAHLEPTLKTLGVSKLKNSEYPVTSAYFITDNFTIGSLVTKLYLEPHTSGGVTTNGLNAPIFVYFPKNCVIGNADESLKDKFDLNNDEYVDAVDLKLYIQAVLNGQTSVNGKTLDLNDDGEAATPGDMNKLVDVILSPDYEATRILANRAWSKFIYKFEPTITSLSPGLPGEYELEVSDYFPEFTIKQYELIDGKDYIDIATNKAYRYEEKPNVGIMHPLTVDFVGERGITVNYEEDIPVISQENTCVYIDDPTEIENLPDGLLFIYAAPVNVISCLCTSTNSKPNTTTYDINAVTAMINCVLGKQSASDTMWSAHYCDDFITEITRYVQALEVDNAYKQTKLDLLIALNNKNDILVDYFEGHVSWAEIVELFELSAEIAERPYFKPLDFPTVSPMLMGSSETTYYYLWPSVNGGIGDNPIKVTEEEYLDIGMNRFDTNGDGQGDINDVTFLINMILGVETNELKTSKININKKLCRRASAVDVGYVFINDYDGKTLYDTDTNKLYCVDINSTVKPASTYLLCEESTGGFCSLYLNKDGLVQDKVSITKGVKNIVGVELNKLTFDVSYDTDQNSNKHMYLQLKYNGQNIGLKSDITDGINYILGTQSVGN